MPKPSVSKALTTSALTRGERRPDQSEEPGVLSGPVRVWVCEPLVVPARGYTENATQRLHAVLVSIGLDELIRRADSPCAQLREHRHRPRYYPDTSSATVHQILGTPRNLGGRVRIPAAPLALSRCLFQGPKLPAC